MHKRRRHDEEEHENHERWLITYADMITLLLALFMMLYAMSVLDLRKFQAFREAFNDGKSKGTEVQALPNDHNPPDGDPQTQTPGHKADAATAAKTKPAPTVDKKALQELEKKLEKAVDKVGLSKSVSVTIDDRGVVVFVTDGVLFASGEADLLPAGATLLGSLGPVFQTVGNDLVVEGHTDDVPISSPQFPTNWELSTSRATTVLRFLLEREKLRGDRMSATGYAETRPRVPNDSPDHRAANRRVEVVVIVPQLAGATATGVTPASTGTAAGAATTAAAGH